MWKKMEGVRSGLRGNKFDLEANMNSPAARQTDMAALLPRPAIDSSRLSL